MGSVVFQWQEIPQYQLIVVYNREHWYTSQRVFKRACWWDEDEETKDIFGGREETKGGTYLGCSKQGRVAFLIKESLDTSDTSELLAVKFLKGKMTPSKFAEELVNNKDMYWGCSFGLVVVDIPSKSMIHISKEQIDKDIKIDEVGPGFHSLYLTVPIPTYTNSLLLKHNLREIVAQYEDKESTKKNIAHALISDDARSLRLSMMGFEFSYGTTALAVNTNGEVSFYEKYLENGVWHEDGIEFEMVVAT